MMDEALLGEQQKNTHYNMTDNKHIEKFLTFSVQHRISQSHLHIVLAMLPDSFFFSVIGAKSNCCCRPELQSVFTVLSDKPTSGKYKIHPDFNLKSEKALGSRIS